jgi:drug/metabolite transporter (DMT)-like permease
MRRPAAEFLPVMTLPARAPRPDSAPVVAAVPPVTAAPTPESVRHRRLLPAAIGAALALIWGSSFILMKQSLAVFDPVQLGGLRLVIAAAVLSPLLWATRSTIVRPIPWGLMAWSGLLGNGIPAFLFAFAQTQLDSATAGILNSLTPVFVILIGALAFRDPPGWRGTLGILLGLTGAVVLVTARSTAETHFHPLYAGLIVLATVCYGVSVNLMRHKLYHIKPLHSTGLALLTVGIPAGVWMLTTGLWETMQKPGALGALGFVTLLAAFGTAISVVLFNKLIHLSGTLYATSVTYLIPVVAMGWGLLDGESIGLPHLFGMGTILAGVWLANHRPASA